MTEDNSNINQLLARIEALQNKQQLFQKEIEQLRSEAARLKTSSVPSEKSSIERKEVINVPRVESQRAQQPQVNKSPNTRANQPPQTKANIEKFIGENLINKIGIAITVIGVGIGAKYAIDNELISPLTRIILGYLVGLGLLGFAIKLKNKYEKFSAVLLSGAMAIMYFITFIAYSFYDLLPQTGTFGLMVLFTGFTILSAIKYNQQAIAHIGLVGAYGVPFLLSDGSGRVDILFGYMSIINAGILVLSFKKYWKPLYYVSFVVSWLIYISWYYSRYVIDAHFELSLIFLSIFFVTFYITFLAYKFIREEKFEIEDVILVLANSFVFYGLGYHMLNDHEIGKQLLGVFTLINAVFHFIISVIVYRKKLADKNIFFLIIGLVLVFITIAIPVQLDGNWVTLLWAGEAAILFCIGRIKHISAYEKLSYPLMLLAFGSIIHDWAPIYHEYVKGSAETRLLPVFNIKFLSSLLFILAFGVINYLNSKKKYLPTFKESPAFAATLNYVIGGILLIATYYAFRLEISNFWNQFFIDSEIQLKGTAGKPGYNYYQMDHDLRKFKTLWILCYSMLFAIVLSFLNLKVVKRNNFAMVILCLNVIMLFVFLIQGLYMLSELRESYISQSLSEYYTRSAFNVVIRYVCFAFVGGLLVAIYNSVRHYFNEPSYRQAIAYIIHISLVWIASSEVINWLDLNGAEPGESYKLGLSILWGVYSLFLVGLGIGKNQKHLRILAMVMFALTLLKLFFYDIAHLETIAKTIVFVSLGILLLIISFLYNKYKDKIFDETKN